MLSKVRMVLRSYFGSVLVFGISVSVIRLIPSVLLSTVCGLNVGDSDTDRCRASLGYGPTDYVVNVVWENLHNQ